MKKEWMIKTLALGIIVLFICMNINFSLADDNVKKSSIPVSDGNTLYVGGSGEGNYSRIQDAIDNASVGDTVFVYDDSSPYYENVIINKSITLLGENRDNTIIDAGGLDSPVWIGANSVTVCGFTLQNSGNSQYNAGVHIGTLYNGGNENCKVIGNKILNSCDGIYAFFPFYHLIEENMIMNNRNYGIYLHGSGSEGRVQIINNTIINNSDYGIGIYDTNYNNIIGNIFINNGYAGLSIRTTSNYIAKNIIKNHTYGIKIRGLNTVKLNSIENNNIGIYVDTGPCKVEKNNFINNQLHAFFSWDFTIPIYRIRWNRNYWDDWNFILPRIIRGERVIIIVFHGIEFKLKLLNGSWVNFDWHPVKEPYDIGV